MCAPLAAKPISEEQLDGLINAKAYCEDATRYDNRDLYFDSSIDFHEQLFAYINSFLTGETRALGRRLRPFRRLQLQARGRMSQLLAEHVEIIEATKTGDIDKADEISNQHLKFSGQRFYELLFHIGCGP